ncbi:MAG: ParB/RepB/Spo0J family partition protein [Candidatus Wallbacteria bacterium]|nr:ParB/RepB/Spo0J family partition protein [Candidatus Wallbacteria bacterium]
MVGHDLADGRVVYLEIKHLLTEYAVILAADPAAEEKLLASIAQHGQKVAILVAREGRDRDHVLDGFRRVRVLEQLGRDVVAAVVWPGGTAEGLVEARRLRSASRSGPLEEGWLIEVLVDRHQLSLSDIALRMGKTKSWVSRRLALVRQLPDDVREKVLAGALSGYIAAKCAVPLARANAALVDPFCESVIAHELSTRQAEVVYRHLIRVTDPQIQREILARPARVLGPVSPPDVKHVPHDLAIVERVDRWCRHTASLHGLLSQLLVAGASEDTLGQLALGWKDHRDITRGVLRDLDHLAGLAMTMTPATQTSVVMPVPDRSADVHGR